MINSYKTPVVSFFLFILLNLNAQVPAGGWRDHLPYSHASRLAEYDNRIFCATRDGSLFSYSLKDGSITKHSKVNGLSDAGISVIGSSGNSGTFIIGYSNGNIDLIRNDSIMNIPDIKRKMIMGGKSVNAIEFIGNYAYLGCDFGIVVIDLKKREIKDTYIFGPNGTQIVVNDITTDGSNLIAATDRGIYYALLNHPNLLDYNAWTKFNSLPDPSGPYKYIACYSAGYFAMPGEVAGDQIITFDKNSWNVWMQSTGSNFEYLGEQNGQLIVTTSDRLRIFDEGSQPVRDVISYIALHVLIDSRNTTWYAAAYGGLVNLDNGMLVVPPGPPFLEAGDIEIEKGNVWIGGGTFKTQWSGYGAYSFIDEKWQYYNGENYQELKDFLNISEIAIDPLNSGHVLGGSYGYGIAEILNGDLIGVEDENDGVLKPVTGYEGTPGYTRITGVDFNADGIAYAVGSNSETALYRKAPGGKWTALETEYEDWKFSVNTGDILCTSEGQNWVIINTIGLFVFTEENGIITSERMFPVSTLQDNQAFDVLLCITEDKDGDIWVGTNRGPVIYKNQTEIFDLPNVYGSQILVPRNDGTTFGSYLLSSEQINDIEVDGANRKWLATEKTGVYLVSSDGLKEIYHFTAENSPLLSNSVQTVAVNDVTGEVFFGTANGIIGFRAGATEGGDDFGDVYVFPNPVRETFRGDITITGLARDVNVKITDVAGNVVYETKALGGQATWNGRNFRGDRVHTGVYLVFCTNEDGSKTHVTKLLFIH